MYIIHIMTGSRRLGHGPGLLLAVRQYRNPQKKSILASLCRVSKVTEEEIQQSHKWWNPSISWPGNHPSSNGKTFLWAALRSHHSMQRAILMFCHGQQTVLIDDYFKLGSCIKASWTSAHGRGSTRKRDAAGQHQPFWPHHLTILYKGTENKKILEEDMEKSW